MTGGEPTGLAAFAYKLGRGSIDWATMQTAMLIEGSIVIAVSRAQRPETFSACGPTPTLNSVARRILGNLIEAGWSPPPNVPEFGVRDDSPAATYGPFGDMETATLDEIIAAAARGLS